jgi:short-chain fatty acids transporter
MILIFLSLGLLLHSNSASYLNAAELAVKAGRGIIVQFPLYAGIAGMMTKAGLVTIFSNAIISLATIKTFPVLTFLCAGIVNFFIPSGGGQWAIQGPIMMQAAYELGADPALTIMAFTWGDGWTNQIQPFWALPLLGVAGLSARDIMGYLVRNFWDCNCRNFHVFDVIIFLREKRLFKRRFFCALNICLKRQLLYQSSLYQLNLQTLSISETLY